MEAQLNFEVTEQHLVRCDKWNLMASESENYLRAKFTFKAGPWVPSNSVATFQYKGINVDAPLDENGECFVPNEALATAGVIYVSVYCSVIGQKENEYDVISDYTALRLTTNPVGIYIHPTLPVFHSGGES